MNKIISGITLSFLIFPFFVFNASAQNDGPPAVAVKDYVAYLFAYFTGNKIEEESIRFGVSTDGYNYKALNKNKPVVDSKLISSTGGVRDPHIIRSEDGKTFYMVVTDMISSAGWDSNRAMVLLKSTDLVKWTSAVVNIQKDFSGNENLKRVWAPQTIYDTEAGKYMIYFSMKHGDEADRIYYAYANADFTKLESAPKPLFLPASGKACIDGDIIKKDGVYHLFYKTESGTPGIKVATTKALTSGKWEENDEYLQQTKEKVEGSGVFKINRSDEYILMYDLYSKGGYQFTKSKDLEHFKVIDTAVTMDFKPRHGTIMPITRSELNRLYAKWGKPAGLAKADNNPVLEGYHADPEVLYAKKTGKYYIYPTTDGFTDWSGYYFKAFSSTDLTNWKDEGTILDLKKDVPWAGRNAWAPCIVEKKVGGRYQYFYYFTGAQKVGLAVSDNPTGPFKDTGKPFIAKMPEGITDGQVIDPDAFTDPKTNKSYLYWGNGFMAGVELSEDMRSIKQNTFTIMNPDKTFREGTYVFYRKGKYYFMWSEDDTRSPNYKVRYATSDSPLGKLTIPKDNIVISGDEQQGIYATGHNSVLQLPGKDEWYLVYHRFAYPDGFKLGSAAGFNREVCMDHLYFNEDGSIIRVKPTKEGVEPLKK